MQKAAIKAPKTLTEMKQMMLNGDAEKWAAVLPASTTFKRPSEWSAAAPLVKELKAAQAAEATRRAAQDLEALQEDLGERLRDAAPRGA